jgi:hypothetical protein
VVISFTTDLTFALDSRCRNSGFDRTAMAIAGPGRATPCARCQPRVPCRHGLSFQSTVDSGPFVNSYAPSRKTPRLVRILDQSEGVECALAKSEVSAV